MIQYKKSGKAAFAMCLLFILSTGMTLFAEERKFYFGDGSKDGFVKVTPDLVYGEKNCWGYDLQTKPEGNNPFFFSIDLPEGSYRVTLLLGNEHHATNTNIRSESRRLMLENVETAAGEFISRSFTVNIRNIRIDATRSVRIKPREVGKLNWDDKLTLEINGKNPGVREMIIRSVDLPTIFLAGNSTVTDQDNEPWCGWGQMLPRFLNEDVVVANYAESGEAGNSFISAGRFDKILTQMKEGDYLFIEFGHNDQKQKGADRGPYTSYKQSLKQMIEGTRAKGATPVLVTPMHRRRFDETGKISSTTLGRLSRCGTSTCSRGACPADRPDEMSRYCMKLGARKSRKRHLYITRQALFRVRMRRWKTIRTSTPSGVTRSANACCGAYRRATHR